MREKFLIKNKSMKRLKNYVKLCSKKVVYESTLFLEALPLLTLKENENLLCEEGLTEKEPEEGMINMTQEKSPGNDELTKEFHKCFWEDLKDIYFIYIYIYIYIYIIYIYSAIKVILTNKRSNRK